VANLLRLCGHGEHDDASYVDPMLRQAPIGRDCLKLAEDYALTHRWSNRDEIDSWRAMFAQEAEQMVAQVQREGSPDPFHEQWTAISTERLRELHSI
jgi:pyruvate dehydrogenase E1 component alpha subunit/2-oxoisovalerate dehydrogenase E1 component alpha subunit